MMYLTTLLFAVALCTPSAISSSIKARASLHGKCNKKAASFTLKDIYFSSSVIYSTPAHLAVSQGHVEFNITNSAVPYKTHCQADSVGRLPDFFYGDVVYQCDAPTGKGKGNGTGITTFTFSKSAGTFNVTQAWSCNK
jgi:hypothetical protein